MTPITLALLIFGIMLLLMIVRVPIAGAMFLAGTAGFILQTGVSTDGRPLFENRSIESVEPVVPVVPPPANEYKVVLRITLVP